LRIGLDRGEEGITREWNPGRLMSVSSVYRAGCTLQATVRLQIFTGLAARLLIATDLAAQMEIDGWGDGSPARCPCPGYHKPW